MNIAVVIPTLNERANVGTLVPDVCRALPGATVWVLDDASPDGTADEVAALGLDAVRVVRRTGAPGLARAYVEGFGLALAAGATRIVQMDADWSHDPGDLARLVAIDADVVIGSRYVVGGGTRNWPIHRRALSRFGGWYAREWTGMPWLDLTGGYKVWKADTLREVLTTPVRSEGYLFQVELTYRAATSGALVLEAPIVFTERTSGSSKMNLAIAWEAAIGVPRMARGLIGNRTIVAPAR